MALDPHIVGRIEESRIDTRAVADDPLQKSDIAAVATSDPVLAENPDITGLVFGVAGTGGMTSSSGSASPDEE